MNKHLTAESNHLLFIGPYSKKPMGGVAYVLNEYEKIFPNAYFITSTVTGNKIDKILAFVRGISRMIILCSLKSQISIIHIHGASFRSFNRKFFFFKIAKFYNKKVIYHIHGGAFHEFYNKASQIKKIQIKNMINNADHIICLSKNWEVFFRTNFTNPNISVIPNIISRPNNSITIKANSHITKFLFLGLIDYNKGVWFLLETLSEHINEISNKAVFYIGGNGQTDELEKKINEFGLNHVVKYLGWVSGEEKNMHLTQADVYVLPSYHEGLPISILEAMSYSLPVLSTAVGGIPEIVSEENGRLIKPGCKKQLWAAIEFFINIDTDLIKEMGSKSIEKVQFHMPEYVREKLLLLYNKYV